MNLDTLIAIAGAFGGLEALKWLVGLRASRRKASSEAAECFENVVTKRVKTYEDSILFLQNQLQEKERQFADLSAKYQESMQRELKLTREAGDAKLKYRASRCDRKTCAERKPPFTWMKTSARKTATTAAVFLLLATTASCTRKIYVPVEKVRVQTDTAYRTATRTDTIRERDSIFVATRGDTIIREAWKFRERIVLRRDTVYVSRRDSIETPRIVEVAKTEKSASGARTLTIILLTAAVVAFICRKLWNK